MAASRSPSTTSAGSFGSGERLSVLPCPTTTRSVPSLGSSATARVTRSTSGRLLGHGAPTISTPSAGRTGSLLSSTTTLAGQLSRKRLRAEHRSGVERVVIARQQVEGDVRSGLHGFERADDHLALDLVGLEHVAADDDEGATLLHRQGADAR